MTRKKNEPIKLSPGELELLELLWNSGPLTISGVHQEFLQRNRKIGYPTVQTRLNRLADKGILRKKGYPALYEATLKPSDITGQYFDLLETLCGGNVATFMLHLTGKRSLGNAEIEVLKKIIEEHEQQQTETPGKRRTK